MSSFFFHDGEANQMAAQTPSGGRRQFLSGGMIAGAAGLAALLYPVKAEAQSAGQWFDVTAYGAVGNGTNYDWPGINAAITAMSAVGGILYFPPGKRYWIGGASAPNLAKEIQLRVDNTTVLAWGAEIFATANTDSGDLMAVVDRGNPGHIVNNVSIYGGLFTPGSSNCNGIGVAHGRHILLCGCRVNNSNGQNAFVIQTDNSVSTPPPPAHISFVRLVGCESFGAGTPGSGGACGLQVLSSSYPNNNGTGDGLIQDVIADNMHIADANMGIWCGTDYGNAPNFMDRVSLSNISIVNAATGVRIEGVNRGNFSNISMSVSFRGLECHFLQDCLASNIQIAGPANSAGIFLDNSYGNIGSGIDIINFDISGSFPYGIYNNMNDCLFGPGRISNCTTGLHTNADGQRSVYMGMIFDTCTTPVDIFRAADKYFKLVNRVSGAATLYRDDTQ